MLLDIDININIDRYEYIEPLNIEPTVLVENANSLLRVCIVSWMDAYSITMMSP